MVELKIAAVIFIVFFLAKIEYNSGLTLIFVG
jgi:hypothetical protein